MNLKKLTCFKAYDIRGEIGFNIDEEVAYSVGRAVAEHFSAKSVVIGFDARETSPAFASAAAKGCIAAGADVLDIGLSGTEEMYWAVSQFKASAGIQVTASHNPINFNGMKIVKAGSRPLEQVSDFRAVKILAENEKWQECTKTGSIFNRRQSARRSYVTKVLSFVDLKLIKPLKIVVNSGNGAAGPTFDAISKRLKSLKTRFDFTRVQHTPDYTFPNGIPNPILPENHAATGDVVKEMKADFGIAFDGDFDRCFFFDEFGRFIPSEYIVGLLSSIFLEKEPNSKIVHDPRLIWNTQEIIGRKGGIGIQAKTGHAFIKQSMREHAAIYGGEISAHHYFRDFAYCDSGMIPWLLVAEVLSRSGQSIGDLIKERYTAFPSSGEINYVVNNADNAISSILKAYENRAISIERIDGVSLTFDEWRFNLRKSNTEPLVRLNIEAKGTRIPIHRRVKEIAKLLESS